MNVDEMHTRVDCLRFCDGRNRSNLAQPNQRCVTISQRIILMLISL